MSRPWDGRNHCGGSRAAEPVADVAVLTIEPGPAFAARLRAALGAAPLATRYLIQTDPESPSPLAGGPVGPRERRFSATRAFETSGWGTGSDVVVYAIPVSDTCKEVVDGLVRRTVPRDSLVTLTGPWVFTRQALTDALDRVAGRDRDVTGMVDVSEAARLTVRVVVGG